MGASGLYVYKDPVDPAWRTGPLTVRNTKTCCGFFRTGLCYSDIRQYLGSVLRDMGVTSLIITGAGGDYRVAGDSDRFSTPLVDACSFLRNSIHETCVMSLPLLNQTRKLAQTVALLTYLGGAISNLGWDTKEDD